MISPRETLGLAILAAAAIASWYITRPDADEAQGVNSLDSGKRGYYLTSARILGTGADGHLLYELLAARAEQQSDNRVAFTDVHINYSPQSEVPWSVDADTATIHPDEQRVRLEGHVRAVSSEGFSGNDTEIRTQYLEIDPENFTASTDRRVQIRIGARSLTATGMLASLKENQLELKSNVGGKFAP